MRKSKKEIKDREVIDNLLSSCLVGRLGTIGKDRYPIVKPLNYIYLDGHIYFHSAKEGEKIDDILRDNRVCFEIDQPIAFVKGTKENPCRAEFLYRSIIIKGRAYIVEDDHERLYALKDLMRKYQPEGDYGDFLQEKLNITAIIKIEIEEMTGKEDLGKNGLKEAVLKAIEKGDHIPIVIDSSSLQA